MKNVMEYKVSSKRIISFINSDDVLPNIGSEDHKNSEPQVIMDTCSFSIHKNDDNCILNDIKLDIKGNKLIIITGKIGCGKTLLLKSILNELYTQNGSKYINGNISYQPQKSMVISMSFKNNILFGSEFDEKWYNQVTTSCGLTKDIELLSNKDNTIIGEKGVNLSGGQKTRLNLARCVYKKDCDIYLFDDPLSSVDTNVANHIFNNVLSNNGILKDKLRILVTHQLQYLHYADQIILMDNGRIKHIGKFDHINTEEFVGSNEFVNYEDMAEQDKRVVIDSSNIKIKNTINRYKHYLPVKYVFILNEIYLQNMYIFIA